MLKEHTMSMMNSSLSRSGVEQDKEAFGLAEGMAGNTRQNSLDVLLGQSQQATVEAAQGMRSLSSRPEELVIGEDIPDLHGFKESCQPAKQEKHEHRIIALLKASGYTNSEIALQTGFKPSTISYIVKTPWAKQFIMEEIHRRGGAQVQEFMARHAMGAAEVLVDGFEMEDMEARRDRVAAADKLLDRVFGRPTQTVVNHKGTDLNELTDADLAQIAQQDKLNGPAT